MRWFNGDKYPEGKIREAPVKKKAGGLIGDARVEATRRGRKGSHHSEYCREEGENIPLPRCQIHYRSGDEETPTGTVTVDQNRYQRVDKSHHILYK